MTEIITVAARKGGVAKTTTAVNLASALVLGGYSVLIVDADSQGHAADLLGLVPADGDSVFADFLAGRDLWSIAVDLKDRPGDCFMIVPGDNRTLVAERSISSYGAAESLALRFRAEVADLEFDYVVIDTPGVGIVQDWSILAADLVVIPAAANYLGVRPALDVLDLVRALGSKSGRRPGLMVLPVMVNDRTRDGRRWIAEINSEFSGMLSAWSVPLTVIVAESATAGVPVVEYAPNSAAAAAYHAAAAEAVDLLVAIDKIAGGAK